MRVIVCRTGGAWHGPGGNRSVMTSQANHDAVARAILDAGHDVLCVGRITGDLGIGQQITWDVKPERGINDNMIGISAVVDFCVKWKPDVLVNVVGSECTNTTPTNKRGNEVQVTMWRYFWPFHELMRVLQLPRICVVTDCRCYPREQEFIDDPWAIPAAVLSQETKTIVRRVLDHRLTCRAVYAGIERLRLSKTPWWIPRPEAKGVIALAHAHMTDGRIRRGRQEAWEALCAAPEAPRVNAVGEGWEHFEDAGTTIVPMGSVPHDEVQQTLSRFVCGPLMPMRHGWISPKLGEYARAGCVPLPHGRGGPLTYDWCEEEGTGHIIHKDNPIRVEYPDELRELAALYESDYKARSEMCDSLVAHTQPDPAMLLRCVEHFGRSGEWNLDEFGGMFLEKI